MLNWMENVYRFCRIDPKKLKWMSLTIMKAYLKRVRWWIYAELTQGATKYQISYLQAELLIDSPLDFEPWAYFMRKYEKIVVYGCGRNATLFGEHFAKRGPLETMAREILLRKEHPKTIRQQCKIYSLVTER